MSSIPEKILCIAVQFGGYFFQIGPAVLLLYAPFADAQLKTSRKRLLAIFEAAIAAVSLLCALILGEAYAPEYDETAVRQIANGMLAAIWAAGSAVYALSFKKETRCRLLSYMIAAQYALFTFTAAELVSRFADFREEVCRVPYSETALLVYMAAAATVCPLLYLFLKKYGFQKLRGENRKNLSLISAVSVLLFALYVVSALAGLLLFQIAGGRTVKLLLSILMACMFLMELLAYFIFFSCLHIEEEKERMHIRLTAFEIQAQYTAEKISEEKRMRHNLRHHFRTLVGLLENGSYGEMEDYLRKYLREWEQVTYRNLSGNSMLDTILSYYINQAEQKGIRVSYDIEVKAEYPFAYMDMTVLLGNALENAVEACAQCMEDAPHIRIDIFQVKKHLLIKIENSCISDSLAYSQDRELPVSSKRGRLCGHGIRSMRMIAEKYDGDMEYWKLGNVFTLRIILNIPDAEWELRRGGGKKR